MPSRYALYYHACRKAMYIVHAVFIAKLEEVYFFVDEIIITLKKLREENRRHKLIVLLLVEVE